MYMYVYNEGISPKTIRINTIILLQKHSDFTIELPAKLQSLKDIQKKTTLVTYLL